MYFYLHICLYKIISCFVEGSIPHIQMYASFIVCTNCDIKRGLMPCSSCLTFVFGSNKTGPALRSFVDTSQGLCRNTNVCDTNICCDLGYTSVIVAVL